MLDKLKKIFSREGSAKEDLCVEGDLSCQQFVDMMTEYMEEDLTQEDKAIWERHFSDCPNCNSFFNSFKSSVDLVQHLQEEACPQEIASRLERIVSEKAALKREA